MQRGIRLLGALVLAVPFVIVPAAPALAGGSGTQSCPTSTDYTTTGLQTGWAATQAYSAWLAGPGTITYTESEAATFTGTFTASWSFSSSVILATVNTTYSISLGASTTYTKTWSYAKPVPSGSTARAVVAKRADSYNFDKYTDNPNCTTSHYGGGHATSPFTANTLTQYCVSLDTYPETTFQATSGACSDH